ncbi:uncharacterized protein LOC143302367 isoform X2 [Babylonia areolata]|uniref:uncharacterized protein LOC143302367 isoform X2 n=1 Tax=Babylonia areolata TaxID=304850 RepID=UPI003FD0826A
MVIKRRDFQKAAAFIHEFLLKLNEDVDCAELRDTLNLSLLHMQKYYRHLQSRSKEKNTQHSLSLSARGLSPMTPFVDAPDKFRWRWVNLDNARLPSNMSVSDSINLTTLPPMIRAVKAGNMKVMQDLIKQDLMTGNDQDGIGRTALMYAVHHTNHKALNFLLESGTDINATAHDGSTALHCACHEGNEVAVSLLLDHGADAGIRDSYGRAAIHWAVTTPGTECLQLLLENNVDPTTRDKDGLSPCMWACRMDNIQHFELLCRSDYSVAEHDGIERDVNGRTWMHWAVRRTEPLECLQTLLTPQSACYKDEDGKTVLMVAAEIGSLPATRLILEIGGPATVDDCDFESRTALHLATIGGHGDVVNYLLEQGADINRPDQFNATAWDYARTRQLHYCQLIIMSHQRQRMMSNPTSPLPGGLGLLLHSENGVQEDFSRTTFRTWSGQSTPITPPHPPKRPRTNRMLHRRANSLTTPNRDRERDQAATANRKMHSAGHERKKERLEVAVNTRMAATNNNFLSGGRQDSNMTDDIDMFNVINDVAINGEDDIDNVSEGGMDVSDIDDTENQHNGHHGPYIHPSPPPPPQAQVSAGQPRRAPTLAQQRQQQQQQQQKQKQQQPQPPPRRSKGGGFQPVAPPHPPTTAPSFSHTTAGEHQGEATHNKRSSTKGGQPVVSSQPPAGTKASSSPQAPPRPSLRSSQQAQRSPGRGGGSSSGPAPSGADPQRSQGARHHHPHPPPPPPQTAHRAADASPGAQGGGGGGDTLEQVASPPLSSQSSDQVSSRTQVSVGVGPAASGGGGGGGGGSGGAGSNADPNRPHSGGGTSKSTGGVSVEGRKIPPAMLTPLPHAPKPPVHDMFMPTEQPIKEKKKKKKKKGRLGGGGVGSQERDRDARSPPQQPSLEISPARGYTTPLHPQPGRERERERGQSAVVPGPKYSRGQPQHSDTRFVEESTSEEPPAISGFAVPIREGTAKSSVRPSHRHAPTDPEGDGDGAGAWGVPGPAGDGPAWAVGVRESIAEEDDEGAELAATGPLIIPPPQGFRGSTGQQQHGGAGGRPLSHSMPQEKSSMKMTPTSAKPPLPRSHRNSASVSRRSSEKDASPRRRSRPPTSRH